MKVKINVLNENISIPEDIIEAVEGDELLARIFFNRGYKDPETIRQMLHEELYVPTRYSEFPGMEAAVERIIRAIQDKEFIAVYGDYDVDGVTSTVTLVQCLKQFTSSVMYHVPDRFSEGYGMNDGVIQEMAHKGVNLIITCDCGVSNVHEINNAKELGMGVIVTDHHNIPDTLPEADVILNPKLLPEGHKARNISGCAMTYFLSMALFDHCNRVDKVEEMLDLLALSLIADVVSLNGENRYLLKKALPRLFSTKRVGLTTLFSIIEKNSKLHNEEDVAFQIAPRINAAGRMESARLPVDLLLSDNYLIANDMAHQIDYLNQERKRVQQDIIKQATEMVVSHKKHKTVLVLYNEFWHHGIIGIAAGKVCETFRKPAILLSIKEDGKTIVGSARSTDEIDIYELIKTCSKRLTKFGGHSKAAGLSLDREELEAFTDEIEKAAEKMFYIKDSIQTDIDAWLNFEMIDEGLYQKLSSIGPYGEGFEPPVFSTSQVTVISDRKTEKKHHIMVLAGENDFRLPAVKWFGGDINLQGKVFDITYKINRNTYRGNSEIQLTLEHIIEGNGKPKKAFNGVFIDERGKSLQEISEKYQGAVFFYEGLSSACSMEGTIDRYALCRAKTLVLVSQTVNSQIFREIITLVNPEVVVLNFSILPDYTLKGFVMSFMGSIKYIINHDEGRATIEKLVVKLCVEENIINAALKYLRALGKIDVSINMDKNEVLIYKADGKPLKEVHQIEEKLKDALLEKQAYQQFILKLGADQFKEYLK